MNQDNNSSVREAILKDLKDLNNQYYALKRMTRISVSFDEEKAKERENKLIEIGQLFVDYYENVFVDKYVNLEDAVVKKVDTFLHRVSDFAKYYIESENYFGLSVLLIPREARIGDPNALENLIESLED